MRDTLSWWYITLHRLDRCFNRKTLCWKATWLNTMAMSYDSLVGWNPDWSNQPWKGKMSSKFFRPETETWTEKSRIVQDKNPFSWKYPDTLSCPAHVPAIRNSCFLKIGLLLIKHETCCSLTGTRRLENRMRNSPIETKNSVWAEKCKHTFGDKHLFWL